MKYEPVIGLEIHAELATKTKMFCGCLNDPNEEHPNMNVCPVCMGHPGTLPVINRDAVKKVIQVGLALGGIISPFSQFDRKNYFYPDLPKGYQISQYKYPLVRGGALNGVRITRVHLEEDTGRLLHAQGGTRVDFNRAGVPLMELVTEPDMRSGEEARHFAEELQLLLRYLNASHADMEKGEMRVEVNISLRREGDQTFGTKVEIKNINSFRAAQKAIAYEVKRQAALLEEGRKIQLETRGWDDEKEITVSQRSKEEAHDYRYFPEPDLPPLKLIPEEGWDIEAMRTGLPELPWQKRERFLEQYMLPRKIVEIFVADKKFADYYEAAASELGEWLQNEPTDSLYILLANYITSDFRNLLQEKMMPIAETRITPENFAELVKMIHRKEISSRVAKDVLRRMFEDGADPTVVVEEEGLRQVRDENELASVAKNIIEANPQPVEDYKKGKEAALQVLVGHIMRETRGTANPEIVITTLKKLLE